MTTQGELELSRMGVPLDLSLEDLFDLAVPRMPADNDFAFTLFHESEGEASPRSTDSSIGITKLLLAIEKATAEFDLKKALCRDASRDTVTFVEKTYYMVNTCATRLVCWNATGTGFFILDTSAFARDVLPEHFKHMNIKAFVRELTSHGFSKTVRRHKTRAIECLEFRHPHFVRGDVAQLTKIQRRSVSSTPNVVSRISTVKEATASDDENKDAEVKADSHMGDLKCEISSLRGDVQQTQELFDKLIVTLMQQQAAASTPRQLPMAPQHPFHAFSHPPFAMHPTGFAHPLAFGMHASHPAGPRAGGADSDDLFSSMFPAF